MMRVVNFHPGEAPIAFNVHGSFGYSAHLIFEEGLDDIHTYQMALLEQAWERGLVIRIWYLDQGLYEYDEFTHGCFVNGKELRRHHNMLRLWSGRALGEHLVKGV